MAKWYGVIGYGMTKETAPGVYANEIVTRRYYGDIIRNTRNLESSGNVNYDINISNSVSILADPFAGENFHRMLYIEYMGAKWKITSVEVQHPRMILTVGGLYNE